MATQPPPWPRLETSTHIDLIEDFLALTKEDVTPDLFRLWSGISLVAGALERRVWTFTGYQAGERQISFPNLYILLVGSPGTGKGIIGSVRKIWDSIDEPGTKKKALEVAPNNMTKASLVDRLAKSTKTRLPSSGPPDEYNSLQVGAEEFGVFLEAWDQSFIGKLNDIYNNPDQYSEERRHGPAREVHIKNPQLNIIGGAQPGWMASTFPEDAWSMGLTSRIIMVYALEGREPHLFGEEEKYYSTIHDRLTNQLARLTQLYGEVGWTEDAKERIKAWKKAKCPPVPQHSRLDNYNNRRLQHVFKLCLISSISRSGRVGTIELDDVERAFEWLFSAEKVMPDIFRAMRGKSDYQVIEELHSHVLALWRANKEKPIPEGPVIRFISTFVPAQKVREILKVAEMSNVIVRMAGTDTYRPGSKHSFGPE